MEHIDQNKHFLHLLCSSPRRVQHTLIKNATKSQIYSICEIVLNILKGNLKLPEEEIQKLQKKKKLLRDLMKRSTLKTKKHLIQRGGFLQFIIPSIITGLASIVSSLIKK